MAAAVFLTPLKEQAARLRRSAVARGRRSAGCRPAAAPAESPAEIQTPADVPAVSARGARRADVGGRVHAGRAVPSGLRRPRSRRRSLPRRPASRRRRRRAPHRTATPPRAATPPGLAAHVPRRRRARRGRRETRAGREAAEPRADAGRGAVGDDQGRLPRGHRCVRGGPQGRSRSTPNAADLLGVAKGGAKNASQLAVDSGNKAEMGGDYATAAKQYERALQLDPESTAAPDAIRRMKARMQGEGEDAFKRARQYDALGRGEGRDPDVREGASSCCPPDHASVGGGEGAAGGAQGRVLTGDVNVGDASADAGPVRTPDDSGGDAASIAGRGSCRSPRHRRAAGRRDEDRSVAARRRPSCSSSRSRPPTRPCSSTCPRRTGTSCRRAGRCCSIIASKKGDAVVLVERTSLPQPLRAGRHHRPVRADRNRRDQGAPAEGDRLPVEGARRRRARRLVAVQYSRPGVLGSRDASGSTRCRSASSSTALTCISSAAQFAAYDPVFAHIAASFTRR